MSKVKAPKKTEDKTPVFTWGFKSSKTPLAGGVMFDYVAQLNQDGTVSCNCPGWRFVKKGQARRCKHTDAISSEVPDILRSWRSGGTFEVKEFSLTTSSSSKSPATSDRQVAGKPPSTSTIKFNRLIEI